MLIILKCIAFFSVMYLLCGEVVALMALTLFVSFPILMFLSKKVRCYTLYLHFIQNPFTNYDDLKGHGINGGRNFKITHNSAVDNCEIDIGVWHILPQITSEKFDFLIAHTKSGIISDAYEDQLRNDNKPVVLYAHGITFSRALDHRIELYQILQKLDVHVITFDYRGYGDSTKVMPTKPGLVEDTLVVYSWIRKICGNQRSIYLWGHSLGTGLGSKAMCTLKEFADCTGTQLAPPAGIILEAPFHSTLLTSEDYAVMACFTWMPHMRIVNRHVFSKDSNVSINSYRYVTKLANLPTLVLHSKDDDIISYKHGRMLYDIIKSSRGERDAPAYFEDFDGWKHIWICRDKRLPGVISEFITKHR